MAFTVPTFGRAPLRRSGTLTLAALCGLSACGGGQPAAADKPTRPTVTLAAAAVPVPTPSDIAARLKALGETSVSVGSVDAMFRIGEFDTARMNKREWERLVGDLSRERGIALKYGWRLRITGSADSATGTARTNVVIGAKRAEAVKALVVELGLYPADLIDAASAGATGNDESNRRVTFAFVRSNTTNHPEKGKNS